MKFYLLPFLLTFLFAATAYSQIDSTGTNPADSTGIISDTTNVENWDAWEDWDNIDLDITEFEEGFHGAPTVYVSWGLGNMRHNNISNNFSEPGSLELKLGNTKQHPYKESEKILSYRMNLLVLSNISTDISSKEDKMKTDSWRFGVGHASGYGYDLGDAAIVPYNSNSFTWTRLEVNDPLSPSDSAVIERYNESFRFGNTTEAGIKFQIIPTLAIEPSYERTVVYERHLFWKWGGSILIEAVAQGLLDEFIEEVIDRSPYAGPIVNFVLKNALSYGMYELRKEKMNWPFPSAPGLLYDQFKVGMTFVF